MEKHLVKIIIPHEQLGFFAGVFLGQIASDERSKEQKDIARKNFRALKNFFDADQAKEITEEADKLFPPDEHKWLTSEMT